MELNKPLGYMLGRSYRFFRNQMVGELKKNDIDLTFDQFHILNMLNSNCDAIQQDLATYMQRDKSVIVRQIDGLIEKELVIRIANMEDKRKRNLVLTQAGNDILKLMKQISITLTQKLLTDVTDNEFEIFRNVLNKIQENE